MGTAGRWDKRKKSGTEKQKFITKLRGLAFSWQWELHRIFELHNFSTVTNASIINFRIFQYNLFFISILIHDHYFHSNLENSIHSKIMYFLLTKECLTEAATLWSTVYCFKVTGWSWWFLIFNSLNSNTWCRFTFFNSVSQK